MFCVSAFTCRDTCFIKVMSFNLAMIRNQLLQNSLYHTWHFGSIRISKVKVVEESPFITAGWLSNNTSHKRELSFSVVCWKLQNESLELGRAFQFCTQVY